ncbi:CvpA family protein, partial [Listeria monocytogenes]|nr:CvpA family protein [Listeria monocytogenes]
MIGLFVLVLLLAAFYGGARRGTSLQLVSVLGYLISFFFAVANYQEIA